MNFVCTITDVRDGEQTADIFGGLYLNCHSHSWTSMLNLMTEQQRDVVYNFTVLCVDWFLHLAGVNYYDDRNEASVMIAKTMAASQKFNGLTYRENIGVPERRFTVDSGNNGDIVKLMSSFVRCTEKDRWGMSPQDYFFQQMLHGHKTIQQNYSRFCFAWFDLLVQKGANSKAAQYKLARLAAPYRKVLPYI